MFVLCVNGENETSKLLHFWPKRVKFRSYVDRFCIWVQNVAHIPLGFGTLEAGMLGTVVLLPIGLSKNCFSVSSVQERLVLLASQLLPSTLIGS